MNFPLASNADIIRCSQKDDFYIKQLSDIMKETGNYQKTTIELVYYFLTTILNGKTLGDEYTEIIEVNKNNKPLQWIDRIKSILLKVVFPHYFEKYIQYTPYIYRIHLALFYINGGYLEISKRILNIKYLYYGPEQQKIGYQILGYFIIIQQIILLLRYKPNISNEEQNIERESNLKCPTCLENIKNMTSTKCGHLFCW